MENKDMPAFPTITWDQLENGQVIQMTEHSGLTKRERIAAQMDVRSDIADYSMEFLVRFVGRPRPSAASPEDVIKWDSECEAKLRVIKADTLLTELSKPQP